MATCPNCGHCPHCGRSNGHPWPYWQTPRQYVSPNICVSPGPVTNVGGGQQDTRLRAGHLAYY